MNTLTKKSVPLNTALSAISPIGEMILVEAVTIPQELRLQIHRRAKGLGWFEIWLPDKYGCRFGCKVHARRRGGRMEYGVFHSPTYGHPTKRQEV